MCLSGSGGEAGSACAGSVACSPVAGACVADDSACACSDCSCWVGSADGSRDGLEAAMIATVMLRGKLWVGRLSHSIAGRRVVEGSDATGMEGSPHVTLLKHLDRGAVDKVKP